MDTSDLTPNQQRILSTMIAALATGKYSPDISAVKVFNPDPSWFLRFSGIGGAETKDAGGLGEGDLRTLRDHAYVSLRRTDYGYSVNLEEKAYQCFRTGLSGAVKAREDYRERASHELQLGNEYLREVNTSSEVLQAHVVENYELSREQARHWGNYALGASVGGSALFAAAAAFVLAGQHAPGLLVAISGIVSQFVGLMFFRQRRSADKRQDAHHESLLERQRILDAIRLILSIRDEKERMRMTETIVRGLLGFASDDRP